MTVDSHRVARDRFEVVVDVVADPVRRYLHRRIEAHLADDVFAEVLVVLWRRLDAVPESDEIAWAIGVARLQLSNAERSRRRQHRLFHRVATLDPPPTATAWSSKDPGSSGSAGGSVDVSIEDLMAGPVGVGDQQFGERDQSDVRAVLDQMRAGDAEILRLWAWEELAPREIATVLQVSANAATVRLHRARKRFEAEWSKRPSVDGHESAKEGSEQ